MPRTKDINLQEEVDNSKAEVGIDSDLEQELDPTPNTSSGLKEETITLSKSELKELIDERVRRGLTQGLVSQKPKRVTERVAYLRFYNDKPVTWYGNVREVLNQTTGDKEAFMDIKVMGEKELVRVKYLEFLNEPNMVPVIIKDQKAEEVSQSQGRMMASNPDEAKIVNKNWQSREIELEVTGYKYVANVEVTDGPHKGETFTVSTEALNR